MSTFDATSLTALAIPALAGGAVVTASYALLNVRSRRRHLASRLGLLSVPAPEPEASAAEAAPEAVQLLREPKYSNIAVLDQMIASRSWAEREAAELTRADIPLRVGEYLILRGIVALACVVITFALLHTFWLALPMAVPGYLAPWLWRKRAQNKRRKLFDEQLVEAVQLLASTLKSGYSFLQGMEAVARELPPPVSTEFDQIIKEMGIGARADEALLRMVERVRSPDLELVVTAIMIQRTVGGELAGILENITRTVRERQKIMRDVSSLTAQQRWSGYIIGAMPVGIIGFISVANPSYSGELFHTLHGNVMLGFATIMEVIGFIMIRKIIAIQV